MVSSREVFGHKVHLVNQKLDFERLWEENVDKNGKEAAVVQEGRKEMIYDEAKAADLKEIIILL